MALSTISLGPNRRIKYANQIRNEAPAARDRYFRDKAYRQDQEALAQNQAQFDESIALQREQMDAAEKQAATSNLIAGAGVAKAAYPYVKKGVTGLSNIFSSSPSGTEAFVDPALEVSGLPTQGVSTGISSVAAPAATALPAAYSTGEAALLESLGPAYTTPAYDALVAEGASQIGSGIGAGEAAIASGSEGAAGGVDAALSTGSSTPIGWIIAAIIGQHLAAQSTNRVVEGQRVGDVFSTDEQGRPDPWFLNDPWHEWLGSQWGFDRPSGGVNLEAAIKNGDLGNSLKRISQGFNQWADPIGDFGYDVIEDRLGKKYTSRFGPQINPVAYGSDLLADSKDVGDFAKGLASVGVPGDPISTTIGAVSEGKSGWDTAKTILTGGLSNICSAIAARVGVTKEQSEKLMQVRQWCIKNKPNIADHYFNHSPALIVKMNEVVEDLDSFYLWLKSVLIEKVSAMVEEGLIEDASWLYIIQYMNLMKEFMPENCPKEIS